MSKDNENIPMFDVGELSATGPQGFTPDQMVPCEVCQRSNPPTRVTCLYCGSTFAFDEKTAGQQRPTLRPPEKGRPGYSNIFLPTANFPEPDAIEEAATLLKLSSDQLERIMHARLQLPLARTATLDEALLVERRLKDLDVATQIISDTDLHLEDSPTIRLRTAEFQDSGMTVHQTGSEKVLFVFWSELVLLVSGRLVARSVEVRERKSGRAENQIVASNETSIDEAVIDIYSSDRCANLRIGANSFDFTCLGDKKGLLAEKNLSQMSNCLSEFAPHIAIDDSYKRVKQPLEFVWPLDSQTDARGWRRDRPGKYSIGAVTEISNDSQFTRYSRLRFYLSKAADHHEIE